QLTNDSGASLYSLLLLYSVEKYRNGSNTNGFSFQLYYSQDGSNWISAGTNFLTKFSGDANNSGFATTPGATASVSNSLVVLLTNRASLFLAWNYSVSTGLTASNAQGLGIDNLSVVAYRPPDVSTLPPSVVLATNATLKGSVN